MVGIFLDKPGNGGLACSRGAPENEGAVVILIDHITEQGAFFQKYLLSEDIGNGLRPDFFRERNIERFLQGIDYVILFWHLFKNSRLSIDG